MNSKLLTSIAVFVLLAAVASVLITQSAYAAEDTKAKAKATKEEAKTMAKAMKEDTKAKAKALKEDTKAKAKALKEDTKAKAKALKEDTKAKAKALKEDTKAKAKALKEDTKAKAKALKEDTKAKAKATKEEAKATTTSSDTITIEMAKGSSTPGCEATSSCYLPNPVTVKTGTKVTWKNTDSAAHTVTSGKDATPDGTFDSSMVMAGKSFSYTFETAGTYNYYCAVHPWMTGVVTVN